MTELGPLLERVRLAVFDFDGVFTDNRVWVDEHGDETARVLAERRPRAAPSRGGRRPSADRLDGAEPDRGARAGKLQVDCVQGVEDKLAVLRERTGELGVALEDTAYVGNDINDAECLRAVGVPVVPADAWPEVKPLARWVLSRAGGTGCVREFCDAVWEAQR